jgi:DNA-binding transcriptional LysR family regulator
MPDGSMAPREFVDRQTDVVIPAEQFLDLARGEADITIRAASSRASWVRKLADCPWGLYCSRAYAAKRGAPAFCGKSRFETDWLPGGKIRTSEWRFKKSP